MKTCEKCADLERQLAEARLIMESVVTEERKLSAENKARAEQLDAALVTQRRRLGDAFDELEIKFGNAVKYAERLAALLGDAFDAGSAFMVGSHQDFRQTHPSKSEWLAKALARKED